MNKKVVVNIVGQILCMEALILLLPTVVDLIYKEGKWLYFLQTIVLCAAAGAAMYFVSRKCKKEVFAREGFVIVALSWILVSFFGCLPFFLSGEIPSLIDAFFETVSGFTTTGSSCLTPAALDAMSHGMLFWRSFTHWIGGMGVIVLIMAIIPQKSGRNMNIMRAEMPGPVVGKILPRLRDTAFILYIIYFALTVSEMVLLIIGGNKFFDSVLLSFGTAGTGGFSVYSAGIGMYSNYSQWVITAFMLLFGVNFYLYYLILVRKIKTVLKSEELRVYLGIVLVAALIICANIFRLYDSFSDTIRNSAFQVSSIVTTTGYSTVDFDTWPMLSKTILVLLMFCGGCAGSTAGGLKMSRIIMMFKMIRVGFKKITHPHAVVTPRFEGKPIEESTQKSLANYFIIYFLILGTGFFLLSFDRDIFGVQENITAVISCFNNIGPGLGKLIGPAGNFSEYSGFSKLVLSAMMLLGRLEIYPLIIAFVPSTWKKA